MLCRGAVTFVDKMDQFIWRAQSVDNTPSDLNSEYSVEGLEGYFRDSGFEQNTLRESGKR